MAIFPPANSGTAPMSGIYASLRQAQILIRLRRVNPRNTQCIHVVNPDMAGSHSLILNPAVSGKHFETASCVN